MKSQLNVRIDADVRAGIEAYKEKHDLQELSDAARHIIKRVLKEEGLLK